MLTSFFRYFPKVYKIAKNSTLIYEEFGLWNPKDGLVDFRNDNILSRKRRNLQKHQLRAATVFMENGSENNTDLDDYQFVQH